MPTTNNITPFSPVSWSQLIALPFTPVPWSQYVHHQHVIGNLDPEVLLQIRLQSASY